MLALSMSVGVRHCIVAMHADVPASQPKTRVHRSALRIRRAEALSEVMPAARVHSVREKNTWSLDLCMVSECCNLQAEAAETGSWHKDIWRRLVILGRAQAFSQLCQHTAV